MDSVLDWIGNSPFGNFMAGNDLAFPWIESIHVLAVSAVLGMIAIVDLRLLGVETTGYRITRLSKALLPITWAGFALAVATGFMLFASNPHNYFVNTAFRVKMLLLVLAGANMLAFHLITWRNVHLWDGAAKPPIAVRAAGATSILIWIGVVICGRWVGFTMDPF